MSSSYLEITNSAKALAEKVCPFVTKPCIKSSCWCYRGYKGPWAEHKLETGEDKIEREVKTGKVIVGETAKCELNVYDPMVVDAQDAPGYSLDLHGNVVGPDGKVVKDDFDEMVAAAEASAIRLKEIL